MKRAAEQITASTYYKDPERWNREAFLVGGIEVCGDVNGEVLFTVWGEQ